MRRAAHLSAGTPYETVVVDESVGRVTGEDTRARHRPHEQAEDAALASEPHFLRPRVRQARHGLLQHDLSKRSVNQPVAVSTTKAAAYRADDLLLRDAPNAELLGAVHAPHLLLADNQQRSSETLRQRKQRNEESRTLDGSVK